MRLQLTPQLSTKDGVSNSNARLYNTLKEQEEGGEIACLRPGLRQLASTTGSGQGIVSFNDTLISAYGSTLRFETKELLQWEFMEIDYTDPVTYPYIQNIASSGSGYVGIGFSSPGGGTFTMLSSDFLSWDVRSPTGLPITNAMSIVYFDGKYRTALFDTVSAVKLYSSDDGITWSATSTIKSGYEPTGWDRLFVVGSRLYYNSDSGYYYTTDGTTWTSIPGGSGYRIWGTDSLQAYFYNYTTIKYSVDGGNTWISTSAPDGPPENYGDWAWMTYGNGKFYIVGDNTPVIYESTDIVNWTALPNQPDNTILNSGDISTYGYLVCNESELALVGRDAIAPYYLAIYNFAYKTWSYVTEIDQYRADTYLIGTDKGFMIPHNLVSSGGVEADNRFVLSLNTSIKDLQALSGSFFDFAQSTL